jgi:hypothetical protein
MLFIGKGGQCRGLEDCILSCRLVVTFCSETKMLVNLSLLGTPCGTRCHAAQVREYENIILLVRHRKLRFSVSYSGDIDFNSRLGYLLVFLSSPQACRYINLPQVCGATDVSLHMLFHTCVTVILSFNTV